MTSKFNDSLVLQSPFITVLTCFINLNTCITEDRLELGEMRQYENYDHSLLVIHPSKYLVARNIYAILRMRWNMLLCTC